MPLVTCPDCRKQISDAAPACPHCGRPQAVSTVQGSGGNVLAAVLSFFIPGLGQLTQGRIGMASLAFVFGVIAWVISFGTLGWVVNLFACLDAAWWSPGRVREMKQSPFPELYRDE